jgi:hypothetical protein
MLSVKNKYIFLFVKFLDTRLRGYDEKSVIHVFSGLSNSFLAVSMTKKASLMSYSVIGSVAWQSRKLSPSLRGMNMKQSIEKYKTIHDTFYY